MSSMRHLRLWSRPLDRRPKRFPSYSRNHAEPIGTGHVARLPRLRHPEWQLYRVPNGEGLFLKGVGRRADAEFHLLHQEGPRNPTKRLGRPVSHGCVRLHPANAAKLYALVESRGVATAKVVVTDWEH